MGRPASITVDRCPPDEAAPHGQRSQAGLKELSAAARLGENHRRQPRRTYKDLSSSSITDPVSQFSVTNEPEFAAPTK